MQVHFGVSSLRAEWSRAVGCIGTFDGVHLGHQAVICEAVAQARNADLPCVLATFDRHPASILAPERVPESIGSVEANLAQFEALGVAVSVVLAFDRALADTSAERFYEEILRDSLRIDRMVVGHDFAFGHGREGTPSWLQSRTKTTTVAPFEIDGRRVSSSAIRAAIDSGDVECAARWLGRPHRLGGVVVTGQKLGRELGFPTVNLARSSDQAVPADGVYAALVRVPGGCYKAAVSIGRRPAVKGKHRTIEAFLIDYPGDSLYGRAVSLDFLVRLRDERNFDGLSSLKDQILKDVGAVERLSLPESSLITP